MPIQTTCPSCKQQVRVPDNLIGKRVKCPSCKSTFTAVEDEERPASAGGISSAPAAKPLPPPARRIRREDQDDEDETQELEDEDRPRISRSRPDGDFRSHRGGMILTLGIISTAAGVIDVGLLVPGVFGAVFSWCCCCGVIGIVFPIASLALAGLALGLGLPAWLMAQRDLAAMNEGLMDPSGQGTTKAGWVLGIIGSALGIVGVLCGVAELILMILGVGLTWGAAAAGGGNQ